MTENFNSSEFACRCECGLSDVSPSLVQRLQVLRDILNAPIIVNSGCRCESYNASVGGAPNSYHIAGMAADIRTRDMAKLVELTRNWSGGMSVYQSFIHVDIGPRRRW